ncbi:MAG: hypothetical protein QOD72_1497, partial [Acidimicrobiaceae bacterium]|nr:hypothetical protein [Acidimicrobiaceae bacterium]
LYRVGGDEFAAIIAVSDRAAVSCIVRDLVSAAKRELAPHDAGISAGFAIRHGQETILDALARADQALYSAKRSGAGTSLASV